MALYDIEGKKVDFVGIGKIMIDTNSLPWNIPHLHFLVYRNFEHFEAVCLEFGLVTTSLADEEAAKRLFDHTKHYIDAVMNKGRGFEELREVASNNFMSDYWAVYRQIEFWLAERKLDLSHELESLITENARIQAMNEIYEAKIHEYISAKANETADEVIEVAGKLLEIITRERVKASYIEDYTYVPLDDVA